MKTIKECRCETLCEVILEEDAEGACPWCGRKYTVVYVDGELMALWYGSRELAIWGKPNRASRR